MTSYEIIGNKEKAVAIIKSSGSFKKDKLMAKEIIARSKNIKSILIKTSKRKGKFRKREYKLIMGDKDTEVIHQEYGFIIKLDPQKVYFSPRESTERQRISKQVKKNEKVLVLFNGVGPFVIAIKKIVPSSIVYGIELNKNAHNYALENIKINKLQNVILIKGDVKKIVPTLNIQFDRIIMPLPKTSYKFLDLAFNKIKKKGIVHFYYLSKKSDLFNEAIKIVKEEAKKLCKKIKIINKRKVLPYSPRIWKICLDIRVY